MTEFEIIETLIKVTAPFVVLVISKLLFKDKLQLNISYFLLAIVLSFYLNIFSIPVAGDLIDAITPIFLFSYIVCIVLLGLCAILNYIWEKRDT